MTPLPVQLQDVLELLAHKYGHGALIREVLRAIDLRKNRDGFSCERREYARQLGLGALYEGAIAKRKVVDFSVLAKLLEALEISPDELFVFGTKHAPWDTWKPGKKAMIVVGGKYVSIPGSPFKSEVVGAQDAKAVRVLERILREQARIQYVPELAQVDPKRSAGLAEKMLEKTCKRKDVGAVIVLGSEMVNPIAAAIARLIFGDMNPRDLPVEYRWSYQTKIQRPFLTSRKLCAPGDEGIALSGMESTTLPRMRDQEVFEAVRAGRLGPFPDCGVLALGMLDDVILILCAGHGGCGTPAAVYGLSRSEYIERRLAESVMRGSSSFTPPNTILEPISVVRYKHSADPIDDYYFDAQYGKGWSFYFEEDERPEEEDVPVHEYDLKPTRREDGGGAEPTGGAVAEEPPENPAKRTRKKR